MKKVAVPALAVVFTAALASSGFAADSSRDTNRARDTDRSSTSRDVKDRAEYTPDAAHLDSKDVIGMKVETPDGKRAGEIDRLIVNPSDGKITHVVVGVGGLAGVGERHVVVPWSQVKFSHDAKDRKDRAAVIDRATLDSAPRYTARRDHDRTPSASPATSPSADRDRDGVPNKQDRSPDNPKKQ